MDRPDASDLLVFLAVAQERSFTRAAARLRMSQPALSQTVRALEERIGIRLLNRTTRSVRPTQAGERLLRTIGPRFEEIDAELKALGELREKPAGIIRIATTEFAANMILSPALAEILPRYPDICVEAVIDNDLTDIVAGQFDAGIRPGELVAKDMIAVRVGPDLRMAVVGAPSYFASRKRPRTPQDLTSHTCINFRSVRPGGEFTWEFEKNRRKLNVRVEAQFLSNSSGTLLHAALQGFGLTYLTEPHVQPHLSSGKLVRVLSDWCPSFRGYHLCYPSRRQASPAFSLLVEAIRHHRSA
jgi:DNA-binding transcriptional LysR family regulator